jgi:hypothetical protein
MKKRSEKKLKNNMEYIKVEVATFSDIKKIKDKSIRILKYNSVNDVRDFFENEFKTLECINCKDKSKGIVNVGFNTENKGAILDYTEFCCPSFSEQARKTLK